MPIRLSSVNTLYTSPLVVSFLRYNDGTLLRFGFSGRIRETAVSLVPSPERGTVGQVGRVHASVSRPHLTSVGATFQGPTFHIFAHDEYNQAEQKRYHLVWVERVVR